MLCTGTTFFKFLHLIRIIVFARNQRSGPVSRVIHPYATALRLVVLVFAPAEVFARYPILAHATVPRCTAALIVNFPNATILYVQKKYFLFFLVVK